MSTILIADDNHADIELLLIAFSENGIQATFHTAHDGREAMELLQHLRPDLMLLDVRMPRIGGLQVLETVRGRSDLQDVPVIIMSSSMAAQDIDRAQSLGALRYWQKASLFADTLALVRTLPELVPTLRTGHSPGPPQPPALHGP
jgi:CheY-like chemotaxis protein